MIAIPITADETASASAALRFRAREMQRSILARHERAKIDGLLKLANQFEDRFIAAATYAASVEKLTGEDE